MAWRRQPKCCRRRRIFNLRHFKSNWKSTVIRKRLLGNGYIFNPPKFTSHKSENNYCFENLFKEDERFNASRTYGCRVAELNIWNSGERFKNQKISVDYLTFTKKLTIRKGNKGLQIIRLINNREGLITRTQATFYEYDDKKWKEKEVCVADWEIIRSPDPDRIKNILSGNKHLHFEADNNLWYDGKSNSAQQLSGSFESKEELTEVWKGQKSGSWIWIEDTSLPDKIPIWDGLSYAFQGQKIQKTWTHKSTKRACEKNIATNKIRSFTNSQGKWIDTEKFCNHGYKRNISENDLENLKLFCAKPITSS